MATIQTTKTALRRFLLETQLLLHPEQRGGDGGQTLHDRVMEVIRQLECIQIDPVSAVAPNQHLALAARIPGYRPAVLNELLRGGEVFEYFANAACVIPMEDYAIFEPVRERLKKLLESRLEEIRPVVLQVLEKLEREGPLFAKSFESDNKVRGYWDNENAKTKATSHALNLLMDAAEIRIVGREGNQRLFDLTERSVSAQRLREAEQMDEAQAHAAMLRKYFRAYRVFEPSDPRLGWQRLNAGERREAIDSGVRAGEVVPVEVAGLKQKYFILAADTDRLLAQHREAEEKGDWKLEAPEAQVHFLPPLDNLLWSRKRLADLFDFDYRWEIYTPAVKRKYGYYAMPILAGDRLIGRMDPRLDKQQGRLTVQLLQIDPHLKLTKRLEKKLHLALEVFAGAHGASSVEVLHYWTGKKQGT